MYNNNRVYYRHYFGTFMQSCVPVCTYTHTFQRKCMCKMYNNVLG